MIKKRCENDYIIELYEKMEPFGISEKTLKILENLLRLQYRSAIKQYNVVLKSLNAIQELAEEMRNLEEIQAR